MDKLLNKRQVAEKCVTSTRTIDRKREAGEFPEPIDFGGPKWPESVIDQWIEARHEQANGEVRDLRIG